MTPSARTSFPTRTVPPSEHTHTALGRCSPAGQHAPGERMSSARAVWMVTSCIFHPFFASFADHFLVFCRLCPNSRLRRMKLEDPFVRAVDSASCACDPADLACLPVKKTLFADEDLYVPKKIVLQRCSASVCTGALERSPLLLCCERRNIPRKQKNTPKIPGFPGTWCAKTPCSPRTRPASPSVWRMRPVLPGHGRHCAPGSIPGPLRWCRRTSCRLDRAVWAPVGSLVVAPDSFPFPLPSLRPNTCVSYVRRFAAGFVEDGQSKNVGSRSAGAAQGEPRSLRLG